MIHTDIPKKNINKNDFKNLITYQKTIKRFMAENILSLSFGEISNYGAIIFVNYSDKSKIQLTKKKINWANILWGITGNIIPDKNLKNEIMKHGEIKLG